MDLTSFSAYSYVRIFIPNLSFRTVHLSSMYKVCENVRVSIFTDTIFHPELTLKSFLIFVYFSICHFNHFEHATNAEL